MGILLRLYWEFFKTGLFAVGGGMATVPFLHVMGEKTGWFSMETLINMIAVSESTPGAIGINMASYTGIEAGGVPGAVIASLGLVTPSLIIIMVIAVGLKAFKDNKYVAHVFYGIRPASTALIASAAVTVMSICLFHVEDFKKTGLLSSLVDIKALIIFAVIWLLSNKIRLTKKLHPLIFIAMAAAAGILFGAA